MNRIGLLATSLTISVMGFAQSYEGTIEFKMESETDTTTNIYYVKGNQAKLDRIGRKSGKIEASFIFNQETHVLQYVNPMRKTWGEQKTASAPLYTGTCISTKGTTTKVLQGQKCTEYTVKNVEENTEITYWIAHGKYDFYTPFLNALNWKSKQHIYFNQIKDLPKGSMPFLCEERLLSSGKTVSHSEISKMSRANVDESKLTIPSDYKKIEP